MFLKLLFSEFRKCDTHGRTHARTHENTLLHTYVESVSDAMLAQLLYCIVNLSRATAKMTASLLPTTLETNRNILSMRVAGDPKITSPGQLTSHPPLKVVKNVGDDGDEAAGGDGSHSQVVPNMP